MLGLFKRCVADGGPLELPRSEGAGSEVSGSEEGSWFPDTTGAMGVTPGFSSFRTFGTCPLSLTFGKESIICRVLSSSPELSSVSEQGALKSTDLCDLARRESCTAGLEVTSDI